MPIHATGLPNWRPLNHYRLGKDYRRNRDRIVQISGYGWFLHTRDECQHQDGLEVQGGLIGPFGTRAHAAAYLNSFIIRPKA